jgi:hypothetical protein
MGSPPGKMLEVETHPRSDAAWRGLGRCFTMALRRSLVSGGRPCSMEKMVGRVR